MSDIPEETWEAARALRCSVNWNSNSSVEQVARALISAEARGERAAKIVQSHPMRFVGMTENHIRVGLAAAIRNGTEA